MEHIEYMYTYGIDEATIEDELAAAETAVLALADGSEAYAIPVSIHYEPGGDAVLLRLAEHEDSDKLAFVEATEMACLTLYEYADPDDSWSIVVRGPLRRVGEGETDVDPAAINEAFTSLRVFGEDVADMKTGLYRLTIEEVTGRTTGG